MQITIKPFSSATTANLSLAIGKVEDGVFHEVERVRKNGKVSGQLAGLSITSDGKYGSPSYRQEISFEVPEDFPYVFAVQRWSGDASRARHKLWHILEEGGYASSQR